MSIKLKPPKWMTREAKEEFKRVVELLDKQEGLNELDLSLLIDYAQIFIEVQDITQQSMLYPFVDDRGKEVFIHVLLQRRRVVLERLRRDLGLTPESRGIKPKQEKPKGSARDSI